MNHQSCKVKYALQIDKNILLISEKKLKMILIKKILKKVKWLC